MIIELQDDGVRQDVGMVVDAVSEVIEIPASEIEPAPAFGARIRTDFIGGMGKVGGRFVVILQVQRVLSIEEMTMITHLGQADDGSAPRMVSDD